MDFLSPVEGIGAETFMPNHPCPQLVGTLSMLEDLVRQADPDPISFDDRDVARRALAEMGFGKARAV